MGCTAPNGLQIPRDPWGRGLGLFSSRKQVCRSFLMIGNSARSIFPVSLKATLNLLEGRHGAQSQVGQ